MDLQVFLKLSLAIFQEQKLVLSLITSISIYRVIFFTGTPGAPPKSFKYRKVNLG